MNMNHILSALRARTGWIFGVIAVVAVVVGGFALAATGPNLLASVPWGGQTASAIGGAASSTPDDGFFKRSDALFSPRSATSTELWQGVMNSFFGNRIAWTYGWQTYPAEAAPLQIPVQCTFNYWVPRTHPDANQMKCAAADGKTLAILPDVTRPAWKEFQLETVKLQIDAGCRAFQQDGMGASHGLDFGCGTKASINEYNRWLHNAAQEYAESKYPGTRLTFSTNASSNQIAGGDYAWVLGNFDFMMNEIYADRTDGLAKLRSTVAATRRFAAVSAVTLAMNDVWLNQRLIASSYALGVLPIIPWDVYTGKDTPRFFGNPVHFSSLYAMVRGNQQIFDGYTWLAESSGATGVIASLPAVPITPPQDPVATTTPHSTTTPPSEPAPTPEGADGTVTKVDTTTYPDRVTVTWTGQSSFKSIPKGTKVRIGTSVFTTSVVTTVGVIYLPKGSAVAVGAGVYMNVPDGTVTKVDTTTYPDRVTVTWTGQSSFKSIPKGTKVRIGSTTYTTTVSTTVGAIYLPKGSHVAVGDSVYMNPGVSAVAPEGMFAAAALSEKPSVVIAQGWVTKVDRTTYPDRTTITWSRGEDFKDVAKGVAVSVGGERYTTTSASGVGNIYLPKGAAAAVGDGVHIGTPAYYLTVTKSVADAGVRAVHIVNWRTNPVLLFAYLKKSDFPNPPSLMLRDAQASSTPLQYEERNGYYVYPLGGLNIWSVLY